MSRIFFSFSFTAPQYPIPSSDFPILFFVLFHFLYLFVHLKKAFFILMMFKFSLYKATLLHFIKCYIPKHWNGMRTLLHGVFHISIVCNLIRFCTVCLANYIYILHFFVVKMLDNHDLIFLITKNIWLMWLGETWFSISS